uniref:Uncharacterized protein n=1 Tax=Arundo donax TaxID=35708 RepID=A0A0A8YST9_ARUDO
MHDHSVFSFYPDNRPFHGFEEVLVRYRQIVPHLNLSGKCSPFCTVHIVHISVTPCTDFSLYLTETILMIDYDLVYPVFCMLSFFASSFLRKKTSTLKIYCTIRHRKSLSLVLSDLEHQEVFMSLLGKVVVIFVCGAMRN